MVKSFKDLWIWQDAMALTCIVYDVTASFPHEEKYRLTSQMRRSAVSIPYNIAEGNKRQHRKEYMTLKRKLHSRLPIPL